MAVYWVVGTLGQGKGLFAVARIVGALLQGRRVATNMDIYPEKGLPALHNLGELVRIPDKPSVMDLEAIGKGQEGRNTKSNGLLVLDELGTWFNSRSWNEPGRQQLINYFLHVRKRRWDVYLLVQDIELVDKQLRDSLCDYVVYLTNFEGLPIPVVGWVGKVLRGKPFVLPRFHQATIRLKDDRRGLVMDRFRFRGSQYYQVYDTEQVFKSDSSQAAYCVLRPWHTLGRYLPTAAERWREWWRSGVPQALVSGGALGVAILGWVFGGGGARQPSVWEVQAALAQSSKPLAVDRAEPVDCGKNPVDGWVITGGVQVGSHPRVYFFHDGDGYSHGALELERAGYTIREVSDWELKVQRGSCSYTVRKGWPTPRQREQVDTEQVAAPPAAQPAGPLPAPCPLAHAGEGSATPYARCTSTTHAEPSAPNPTPRGSCNRLSRAPKRRASTHRRHEKNTPADENPPGHRR